MLAIYHSHPRSEAYPSQTDINLAGGWPECLPDLLARAADEPVVRAFCDRRPEVEEVELDVD